MGGQKWVCILPESQGISAMQGNSLSTANQPDAELRKRTGTDSLRYILIDSLLYREPGLHELLLISGGLPPLSPEL